MSILGYTFVLLLGLELAGINEFHWGWYVLTFVFGGKDVTTVVIDKYKRF